MSDYLAIGGDLKVGRLGYGTMRLAGPGAWGPPAGPDGAVRLLRRAAELGVTFFDTADSWGPDVTEQLLRRALHPYPEGVVIATKAGLTRSGPRGWHTNGHPQHLRRQADRSLKNLGLERIPLFQLHRIDPTVPLADQIGALTELQAEGKVQHLGLSEVTVRQLRAAQAITTIVSVQNRYNLVQRGSEPVLEYCEANDIAFLPWFPLATGQLTGRGGLLGRLARRAGATATQFALAWLLRRSPVMVPIPGTSSVPHLEENVASATITMSDADFRTLSRAGSE